LPYRFFKPRHPYSQPEKHVMGWLAMRDVTNRGTATFLFALFLSFATCFFSFLSFFFFFSGLLIHDLNKLETD